MHPAVAGLIGAGLALLGCLFAWLIHRGREGLRQIEAQGYDMAKIRRVPH